MSFDIPRNQGALLLGGYFAAGLSGFVFVQTIIYFKMYPRDPLRTKALVAAVWGLDMTHSGLVFAAIWQALIANFTQPQNIDNISTALTLTIVFTAVLTFAVHCFFAHRIFLLSKRNWWLTIPIIVLAVVRLGSAAATSGEMIRVKTLSAFKEDFRWLFSLGLALSSVIDVLVTLSLLALLKRSRSHSLRSDLNAIINSLVLYTFETGALTMASTVVALICWLAMGHNLIFMGLHFVIAKLYANSLLAALNTRKELRDTHTSHADFPRIDFDRSLRQRMTESIRGPFVTSRNSDKGIPLQHVPVQINVEKSVTYE